MYSLLLASRQLYGEFLLKMVAQLLYPAGTDGQGGGKEPMKVSRGNQGLIVLSANGRDLVNGRNCDWD